MVQRAPWPRTSGWGALWGERRLCFIYMPYLGHDELVGLLLLLLFLFLPDSPPRPTHLGLKAQCTHRRAVHVVVEGHRLVEVRPLRDTVRQDAGLALFAVGGLQEHEVAFATLTLGGARGRRRRPRAATPPVLGFALGGNPAALAPLERAAAGFERCAQQCQRVSGRGRANRAEMQARARFKTRDISIFCCRSCKKKR